MGKSETENSRKLTGKALIQSFRKRVEKYDSINNLAKDPAGVTIGQIARSDIDFAKADIQKIFSSRSNRAKVIFADKDRVHGLPVSSHLLVRVRVYS